MKNQKFILSIILLCVFWNSYSQITPGIYTITSKLVNRNLDIKWADRNNGAGLHIWDPNGGEAQKFKVENSNEAGYYYIKSEGGKCLDINGSAPDKLMVWDCHEGDNQKWKFIDTKDGHYNIQSKLGTYIDVRYGKKDNGSEVGMSAYSNWEGNIAQRWKIAAAEIEIVLAAISTNIHNNDCKRMYGKVHLIVYQEDNLGRKTLVNPLRGFSEILNWERGPARNVINSPGENEIVPNIENIGRKYVFDPKLVNEDKISFVVRYDLKSAHKGCDLCTDFTWDVRQSRENHFRLKELLNSNRSKSFSTFPASASDRRHTFICHFFIR